jgi:hypothetical protein
MDVRAGVALARWLGILRARIALISTARKVGPAMSASVTCCNAS